MPASRSTERRRWPRPGSMNQKPEVNMAIDRNAASAQLVRLLQALQHWAVESGIPLELTREGQTLEMLSDQIIRDAMVWSDASHLWADHWVWVIVDGRRSVARDDYLRVGAKWVLLGGEYLGHVWPNEVRRLRFRFPPLVAAGR